MAEKIKVRESSSALKKAVGGGVMAIAALVSVIGGVQLLAILADKISAEMGILLLIFICTWYLVLLVPIARGRKVMVTPILSVDERRPDGKVEGVRINSNVGPVVDAAGEIALEVFAERAARNRFMLCEEGVVLYPLGGPILHRWSKIRSFRAHPEGNRFDIRVSGYISQFSFHSWDNFEGVKRVLSERIQPR